MIAFILIAFIAGGVTFVALRRTLERMVYYGGIILTIWITVRVTMALTVEYVNPIMIGALSALLVCVAVRGYIRHALIYFYLQRSIQRDKDAASAGKLW